MDFNYETEITKFYDWLESKTDMTPSAITLWFALMELWKREGYPDEVVVNSSTLKSKTRLDSAVLKVAADILTDSGRIWYARNKGKQTFHCKIIPFVSDSAEQKSRHDYDSHSRKSSAFQASPVELVVQHYKKVFGKRHKRRARKDVENFISIGVQESLICRALDISEAKGVGTWAYAEGVIEIWMKSGVFSLDDLEKKKSQEKKKQKTGLESKATSDEAVSDKYDKYIGEFIFEDIADL